MLLSSRRHLRETKLEDSRTSRAYICSVEVKKDNRAAYLVQVVDKPDQIIALEVCYTFHVPASTKKFIKSVAIVR